MYGYETDFMGLDNVHVYRELEELNTRPRVNEQLRFSLQIVFHFQPSPFSQSISYKYSCIQCLCFVSGYKAFGNNNGTWFLIMSDNES